MVSRDFACGLSLFSLVSRWVGHSPLHIKSVVCIMMTDGTFWFTLLLIQNIGQSCCFSVQKLFLFLFQTWTVQVCEPQMYWWELAMQWCWRLWWFVRWIGMPYVKLQFIIWNHLGSFFILIQTKERIIWRVRANLVSKFAKRYHHLETCLGFMFVLATMGSRYVVKGWFWNFFLLVFIELPCSFILWVVVFVLLWGCDHKLSLCFEFSSRKWVWTVFFTKHCQYINTDLVPEKIGEGGSANSWGHQQKQ